MSGEDGGHRIIGGDVADDREVGATGLEALVCSGLRRNGTSEHRDGSDNHNEGEEHHFGEMLGH
jgi:hypothetical protein